jgi:hypothetical protein
MQNKSQNIIHILYMCIYIYIYRERERERMGERMDGVGEKAKCKPLRGINHTVSSGGSHFMVVETHSEISE